MSAVVGYLTIKYFLRYLASHSLAVFAWYRLALAAAWPCGGCTAWLDGVRIPNSGLATAALRTPNSECHVVWLRRSFITGFFVTVPLIISVAALVWIFRVIDGVRRAARLSVARAATCPGWAWS